MRSRFSKIFAVLIFGTLFQLGQQSQAQSPHHLLIGNGGVFGPSNYVSVASWELSSGIYTVFDSIPASSVQDLITAGPHAWLAADSFLVKYDLNNYQRLDSVVVPGIRKVAVWQDLVVVTRGFGASSDYVQAFHINDLSPAFSVSGITGECEGIVVVNDSAYVAVPVAFGSQVNLLAVVDLASGTLVREVSLDGNGLSAGRVLSDGSEIYVVLNSPFGGSSGSMAHYQPGSNNTADFTLQHNVGGGNTIHNGQIYLFLDGNLGTYNPSTQVVDNAAVVPGSWAGAATDTTNQQHFLSETDYFSYGLVKRYDSAGQLLDSVVVGISPEALALDSWISTASAAPTSAEMSMRIWPNPANDRLSIDLRDQRSATFRVLDLMGRDCLPAQRGNGRTEFDLQDLPDGTYILRAESAGSFKSATFIHLTR